MVMAVMVAAFSCCYYVSRFLRLCKPSSFPIHITCRDLEAWSPHAGKFGEHMRIHGIQHLSLRDGTRNAIRSGASKDARGAGPPQRFTFRVQGAICGQIRYTVSATDMDASSCMCLMRKNLEWQC